MMRKTLQALSILCLGFSVAACGSAENSIAINASIDGNGSHGSDVAIERKGGSLSVKVPGISADVKIPDGLLAKTNFDIDGVKLYPGAYVTAMNVNAVARDSNSSVVKIAYAAPDEVAKVRDWFAKSFADKSIAIVRAGEGLSGKTSDGDTVKMTFAPGVGGKSTGTIDIIDAK